MTWTNTEERLPEEDSRVLIVLNGEVEIANYFHDMWRSDFGRKYHGYPTKWMPLPEVYENES